MRIETGERKGFKEFSLVVENEDEAKFLWHFFNNNFGQEFGKYLKRTTKSNKENVYDRLQTKAWNLVEDELEKQCINPRND